MLSDNAKSFLADKGFDPVYGARPLKRAIQSYIENPLAMEILGGNIVAGSRVSIDVEENKLIFDRITG